MNTNDFREMWNKQITTPQPSQEELLKTVIKLKNKNRNQLLLAFVSLSLTIIFILVIGYYIEPTLITTRIGIALIIVAILFYLFSSNSLLRLLIKDADQSLDVSSYLPLLIKIREKQLLLGTRVMTLYFILLAAGLLLYMIEYTRRMTFGFGLLAYGITTLWILFNWIYLKPRIVKKQQAKLSEAIKNLENLKNQLS